jgi:hypothetical protein
MGFSSEAFKTSLDVFLAQGEVHGTVSDHTDGAMILFFPVSSFSI